MSRFSKLFAANAIAAAGLGAVAVATSASAAAEPAMPPAVPGVPALTMIQQFATNPASVGAVLQTAATALNGVSTAVGAPAPNTLPVSPIEVGPSTAMPPAAPVAPMAPMTPVTPTGPGQTLVPLLNQLGVPANLVNLAPADLPFIGATSPAPVAAPVPAAPVAPAPPATAAVNPLPLLTALP